MNFYTAHLSYSELGGTMKNVAGLEPIDFGDLFTLAEFEDLCASCGLTDYDGIGEWATKIHRDPDSTHWVSPSTFISGEQKPPAWATHIVWYNK